MLQNATGNQRQDFLYNISDEHVSCTAPATENASLHFLFKCPTPAIFLKLLQILTFCSLSTRCKKTLRQPRKTLLFSSLTLPTSAFPSVHIAGSLTSKLPSDMTMATSLDNCGCIPSETAPPSLREVFLAKLIGACCDQIYDLEIWRFLKMLDPQATMGFSNCHP